MRLNVPPTEAPTEGARAHAVAAGSASRGKEGAIRTAITIGLLSN
jgi:hypothetical protein